VLRNARFAVRASATRWLRLTDLLAVKRYAMV
jgi:hypothetical protein